MTSILAFTSFFAYGQQDNEKTLFIVDSIPVFGEISEEEDDLSENIIDHILVITDKEKFGEYKIYDFNKLIFVFTKSYVNRPEEIKRIPSFKNKFYKKDDTYFLIGSKKPYTGPYIDYYINGTKKEEGYMKNGKDDGLRTYYYKDGKVKLLENYSKGELNGETKHYFSNGKIRYSGMYKNGEKEGIWDIWYSTGFPKWTITYKSDKPKFTKELGESNSLMQKGFDSFDKGDYKNAIIYYDRALEKAPTINEIYFHRSRAYLYDLEFEKALADCNKALEIEPLDKDGYSLRAFIRIRKNELKDSRTLTQNSDITVYATKKELDISTDEKNQICSDLKKGYELGDKQKMILDAIKKYCE